MLLNRLYDDAPSPPSAPRKKVPHKKSVLFNFHQQILITKKSLLHDSQTNGEIIACLMNENAIVSSLEKNEFWFS